MPPLRATMSRLRVAVVGQASGPSLIRVALDRASADATTVRAELIAKASASLGISPPDNVNLVRMYLAGGAVLNDVTMLDKDDTVYFAWRGEAWREPGSEASAAQEPAAGAGDASAEEASQSKPASFRPRSPAEELHVRRSGDAHRQRDAARAHSRLRDGASLARGVPAGLGRRPAHPARPARPALAQSLARESPPGEAQPGKTRQLGACGSPSSVRLHAVAQAHGLQCTWVCDPRLGLSPLRTGLTQT